MVLKMECLIFKMNFWIYIENFLLWKVCMIVFKMIIKDFS